MKTRYYKLIDMRMKTRLLMYAIVGLAYFLYKVVSNLELFKSFEAIKLRGCQVIPAPHGGEDIVVFADTLIFSGDDRIKMESPDFQLPNTPNGQLFALREGDNAVYEVVRINFPAGVAFHPHGMYLNGARLYVINHAYSKGGERVDIFELSHGPDHKVKAHWFDSYVFGSEYYGLFNDLVAISEDEYFVTQWLAYPEGDLGKSNDILSQLKFIVPSLLNMKSTNIFFCKRNNCEVIPGLSAQLFNGIDWDGNNRLWATSSTDKEVYELEFDRSSPQNARLIRKFMLHYNSDNVVYDKSRNELLVASIARAYEFLKFKKVALKDPEHRPEDQEFFTGYEAIDLETGTVTPKFMQKDLIYGISTALRFNDKIYFGTWTDNRIVVCNAN